MTRHRERTKDEPFRLQTASGIHTLDIAVANSFWRRFRGLMLAPQLAENSGLLITRCDSVHCAFMRQSIDVVYLDCEGRVLKCVPHLKPWRASFSGAGRDAQGRRHVRARHTLELAAGAIARLGIQAGDRLLHPSLGEIAVPAQVPVAAPSGAQRGSAMIEFVVVGPILTLIGLGLVQYSMLFFAKNQLNHAAFVAARAGSLGHANINTVTDAYTRALVPLYGGASNVPGVAAKAVELKARLTADAAMPFAQVQLLNPTKESFDDFGNNAALMAKYNTNGKRVIPNSGLAYKGQSLGATSGQTIQDANLIKLRIMHAYEPKIPIVKTVFSAWLKARDPKTNANYTRYVQSGYIPVVTNVTLHMQSDAIEGSPVSTPGNGNNGTPTNPGDPPEGTDPPPDCNGIGCNPPADPVDPGTPCTGTDCPVCPAG